MKFLLILALTSLALAEPPVPAQYLPPTSQYGAPQEIKDYMIPPSSQYEEPSSHYGAASRQQNEPSSQYGAPSSQYGAPSAQYGAPSPQYSAPSPQYGAPSPHHGAPSTQYGAPARKSNYRKAAPTASSSTISFGSARKSSKPSSKYGAPARSQTTAIVGVAPFAASAQYSSPANQYPAPSSAYGASPKYGAPSTRGYSYGSPSDEDDMSEPASYQFRYQVKDQEEGADYGHQEQREGDDAKGEYRVLLPDGRTQVVTYTADERGFIPEIRFEEAQGGYGRGPANSQKGY